jgi:hypothetical protein
MNAYQWGQLGGALFACIIVTMLLYAGTGSWPKSIGKIIFINCIGAILEVLLYAVGSGISAEAIPSFRGAPFYLFWQLVIGIIDFIKFRRAAHTALVPREREEPRF